MGEKILKSILMTFSQSFGYCLLLAIAVMFFYLYAKEHGSKEAVKKWFSEFKQNKTFRHFFLFSFYIAFVLFVTMFNRYQWTNPLQNLVGTWGLHNAKGELTTEFIENILLFIPLGVLIPICFSNQIDSRRWITPLIGLAFSSFIEFSQLILRVGQVQLSDLFCNTLGTIIGVLVVTLFNAVKAKNVNELKGE